MISLLILWFVFYVLLQERISTPLADQHNEQYARLFCSLSLAYGAVGLISLTFAKAGLLQIPIGIASCVITMVALWTSPNWGKTISLLWNTLVQDCKDLIDGESKLERISGWLITITCLVILALSIGPVNHPDAADYHAGYAAQYLLKGRLFIDGGLHQGLTGYADLANIAFYQDNTTWLIRSAQLLPLIPLIFLLDKHGSYRLFTLAFLSAPVFIIWATSAKPMFLGDICIAGCFITWHLKPDSKKFLMLVAVMLIGISFKISALIISLPIAFVMARSLPQMTKQLVFSQREYKYLFATMFAIIMLAVVFSFRQGLTGNSFYPLFSKLMTPNNIQAIEFEQFLRGYARDTFLFPLSLFFSTSLSDIASSLGPCLAIVFATRMILLKSEAYHSQVIACVGGAQFILLLILGQGRADYYSAPAAILVFGSKDLALTSIASLAKMIRFKTIYTTLLLIQVALFYVLASSSLFQTIVAVGAYDQAMRQWAYGYDASKQLEDFPSPHLNLAFRNTRLYYSKPYVDADRFSKCLSQNGNTSDHNILNIEMCSIALGVKSIMTHRGALGESTEFSCTEKTVMLGQRNPFNNRRIKVDICRAKG